MLRAAQQLLDRPLFVVAHSSPPPPGSRLIKYGEWSPLSRISAVMHAGHESHLRRPESVSQLAPDAH
jgi:hypothetical protein